MARRERPWLVFLTDSVRVFDDNYRVKQQQQQQEPNNATDGPVNEDGYIAADRRLVKIYLWGADWLTDVTDLTVAQRTQPQHNSNASQRKDEEDEFINYDAVGLFCWDVSSAAAEWW